jgi:hypothetical protein
MPFLLQLRAGHTVDEVVAAVKDYLHVWEEVLHRLPPQCRPVIERAEDIANASRVLLLARQQLLDSGAPVGHELHMTASFFEAAAARIEELRH